MVFTYLILVSNGKGFPHMNLTENRLKQLDSPALSSEERALLRCRFAADLIHRGQYESAREVMGSFWRGIGQRPELSNLPPSVQAEILLQCGVLSGWLGSQVAGAQERAKDLLTEAQGLFEDRSKISEAQYELGMCYWRLGSYEESRIVLKEALNELEDTELKAKVLIRQTIVEIWTGRYYEARQILDEARSFFDSSGDALKGRWHGQMGLVLRRQASAERNAEYFDRAIIEYTAAIYHYEQAHHERYCATNLNNLAFLLYKLERYKEAHEQINRAVRLLKSLNDSGLLAQVYETRARVFLAERRYDEGIRAINSAVDILEKGNGYALLADALNVQATLYSRLHYHDKSIQIFFRALTLAANAGALVNAGRVALSLIEEHSKRLSKIQLHQMYARADRLLKETQDTEDIDRLRKCARIVFKRLTSPKLGDKDFSLNKVMSDLEAEFIEQALKEGGGSVTEAARKLGIRHQTLAARLKTRHKALADKRTPVKNRKQSIIKYK
jgi:tetratricopeptide (TPR) repeat protein